MGRRGSRTRNLIALAVLAVVVAAAAPAADAAEETPGARDIRVNACPEEEVPDSGFTDIDGNFFADAIECLAWYGITRGGAGGRPADEYAPRLQVARDQMASFLARFVDHVEETLLAPYDGENRFTDVADGSTHVAPVNRLERVGVVQGGPGGRPADQYGPGLPVQRDQMASFVARTLGFVLDEDLCVTTTDFFDDDDGNVHEPCINALTDMGVVEGRSFGVYAPGGVVTRDQMAAFLMRAMDVLVEQEVATRPSS